MKQSNIIIDLNSEIVFKDKNIYYFLYLGKIKY